MKKLNHLIATVAGLALALTSMTLRAEETSAEKPGKNDGFVGVVTKVDSAAKKLTVQNPKDDKEMTFTFSEETNVVDDDGKEIAITTIKEGVRIRVQSGATEDAAKRIKITGKQMGDKKAEKTE